VSAMCASLVAPQPNPDTPVPEVQESLLGSPAADGPTSEEHSPGGERGGHRRINRYGHWNSQAPVLCERVGASSRAEGHGAELDGDGPRAPPAVWGALGQRPTEGFSPITTRVPCPPPPSGAGTNPGRGAGRVAAGRPGRPQEGWPDARGHRGRHQRDAGVLTRAQRGDGGVGRLPRFGSLCC
jgi:hypothetical protein